MPLSLIGILSLATVFVCFIALIAYLIWMQNRTLSFYSLTDEEQTQYMALCNAINTRLLEKFLNTLPLKIVTTFITMGTGLILSGAIWLYRLGKNASAKSDVRKYVEGLKKKYRCGKIDWQSFPNSSLVSYQKDRVNSSQKARCPICNKESLQKFFDKQDKEILICSNCRKSIVVEKSYIGAPENIIIPGFYAIAIPVSGMLADVILDHDPGILIDAISGILELF